MSRNEAEYRRFARRLAREREAARTIVADVRRMPSAYLREPVPASWKTLGVVEELCDAARDLLERAPEKSEALAEYATVIGALVGGTHYPKVLRVQSEARAWKELANAYRYRGQWAAALDALDCADAVLEEEFALAEDRAVVALARATTLREVDRLSEAKTELRSAAAVFRDLGRAGRVAQCELLSGMIQHEANPRGAREAYRKAAEAAREAGDVQTVASAYSNCAVLDAERGRTSAAMDGLQQARAIFAELGATGEIARTTWAVGFALVRARRFAQAIPPLMDARAVFRALRMVEDAGLVAVHLAEAYLALRREREARELTAAIIAEFQEAGLNGRSLAALRYLLALGAAATREHARAVATYLERLRREPTLEFCPDTP
jgi:tetratricopeptide (TPR) repeat protein